MAAVLHGVGGAASPSGPASFGPPSPLVVPLVVAVDPDVVPVVEEPDVVLLEVVLVPVVVPLLSSPPHPVATAPATTKAPTKPPTTLNVAPVNLAILLTLPFKS
jgi:hypothetical protein